MRSAVLPEVTESSFEAEVLMSELPVLVEFTAAWCGPCRAILPALEALATAHAGKLKVAQLDVDQNQALAQRYRVMSMPTLIVFQGGQPAGQLIGAHQGKLAELARQFAK